MAISTNNFKINGLINPENNILDNLNTIATCSSAWITFDAINGLWSVIVNEPSTSVASFNDRNIIGGINISGTGISQLYNAVSVDFPHKDLASQTDYVDITLDNSYWYPNEENNNMSLSFSMINDPIQAQYIGITELKQSRCDKIIQFVTDYSMIGLKAGQVISITNDMYGFTNKPFRITKIEEDDADDGTIQLKITAIEYDSDVYAQTGFVRETRTKKTGIIPKSLNTVVTQSDNNNISDQLNNSSIDTGWLYKLNDVNLNAVSSGQILKYNGSYWVNGSVDNLNSYIVDHRMIYNQLIIADTTFHSYNPGLPLVTISHTGSYRFVYDIFFDTYVNPSINPKFPPTGIDRDLQIILVVNGIDQSPYAVPQRFHPVTDGFLFTLPLNLTAGDTINWKFNFKSNYSNAYYSAPPGYPSYTVDSMNYQSLYANITLEYLNNTSW